jgi:hypothetical protein
MKITRFLCETEFEGLIIGNAYGREELLFCEVKSAAEDTDIIRLGQGSMFPLVPKAKDCVPLFLLG